MNRILSTDNLTYFVILTGIFLLLFGCATLNSSENMDALFRGLEFYITWQELRDSKDAEETAKFMDYMVIASSINQGARFFEENTNLSLENRLDGAVLTALYHAEEVHNTDLFELLESHYDSPDQEMIIGLIRARLLQ